MKKFIKNYQILLDEKLNNGSIIVLIIAFLIAFIGISFYQNDELIDNSKTNVLESQAEIIEIDGKKYQNID